MANLHSFLHSIANALEMECTPAPFEDGVFFAPLGYKDGHNYGIAAGWEYGEAPTPCGKEGYHFVVALKVNTDDLRCDWEWDFESPIEDGEVDDFSISIEGLEDIQEAIEEVAAHFIRYYADSMDGLYYDET